MKKIKKQSEHSFTPLLKQSKSRIKLVDKIPASVQTNIYDNKINGVRNSSKFYKKISKLG
jgi:hypothetical protein